MNDQVKNTDTNSVKLASDKTSNHVLQSQASKDKNTSPASTQNLQRLSIDVANLSVGSKFDISQIDKIAGNYILTVSSLKSAQAAQKSASVSARNAKNALEQEQNALKAEAAVLLEHVRSVAELAGKQISTDVAISDAIQIAKTSRQVFALLLKAVEHKRNLRTK